MTRKLLTRIAFPIVLLSFMALPFLMSYHTSKASEQLSSNEQRLLEIASKNSGIPVKELELLNSTDVNFPITKRLAATAKIQHKYGRIEDVLTASIDEYGQEINLAELRRKEEQTYKSIYGKIDPQLYNIMRKSDDSRFIRVGFWLRLPEDFDLEDYRSNLKGAGKEEVERMLAYREERLRKATSAATSEFIYELYRHGFRVEDSSSITPLVYASLPVRNIRALSDHNNIQRIYFAENKYEDYLNVAAPTIYANTVWNWYGIIGTDARVAIVEDSRVDFDNSCLVNNLGTRVPMDGNVDNHATATAGMVASNNATHRGIGWGAGIYSANGTTYSDSNMSAALDAAASNAHILNNSWGPQCGSADGSMNVHARHADYIVRYLWDTVVAAAGNNGNCTGNEFVGGVATGYNVIAVGNFTDSGTTSWSDDSMNSSSSYKDPTSSHGDREKPEVSAPGTNITSTTMASPGVCSTADVGSGTSYSSPMIAGAAALLIDAKPSLRVFPEALKALILSGATHNIEGSNRLSEFDGAGGIDACQAYLNTANNRYDWLYVTPSSFNASGYININMGWVSAGRRVKVALAWDSTPTSDYTTDPLKADLDLNVVGPGASHWSASWDNSYEVVDFTAPTSGNYTLKIKKYRFDGSVEYVGVAWKK
jgi:hypothetical protein